MAVVGHVVAPAHSPIMRAAARAASTAPLGTFEVLHRWQAWLESSGRFAETTRRQYRRYAFATLADLLIPLDELTEDDLVGYLAGLPAKGGMRGQTIRAMSSLCRYAARRGLISEDPTAMLSVPRAKYGEAPYLDPDELEQVLAAAGRLPDPRARPTLELIACTGARVGSICGVTPADVDLRKRQISFRVSKGSRPYTNPLGTRGMAAARELIELMDYQPPRGPRRRRPTLVGVAPCVVQRWAREAGQMVGLHVWPHLLRHTFAERIANDPQVPEIVVVELMNWRDGSLLRRYAAARGPLKRGALERAGL